MKANNVKQALTHREFVRLKVLGIAGLVEMDTDPNVLNNRYLFVNDISEVKMERLEEYNNWYMGDSDKLTNYFTRANSIDYNRDPLYNRNKKGYFWAVASTEKDLKRTHSGHPRNIVDTLTSIMTFPIVGYEKIGGEMVDETLKKILKTNRFKQLVTQKSRPLTLVEGWGAWKINWDKSLSDYPILLYYRANNVDFVFISNQLRAIIYKDYFQDKDGKNYVLYETRRLGKYVNSEGEESTSLFIEKELFLENNTSYLMPCKLETLPQLKDVEPRIVIENFKHFLGYPNIFYYDSSDECYGRSIFTGKTDIFDDLDQCFSQGAMAVRRSTVHEYFNTLYLETDPVTGLPIQPDAFDRKYIKYSGVSSADGTSSGSPVQVVQPQLNFVQYNTEETNLLINAVAGIMSPSTIGIDVAKKDNATDTREKEKQTIFTRNLLLDEESDIFSNVCSDLLVAYDLMNLEPDEKLECTEYDISIQYPSFANTSTEAVLETVQTGWSGGLLSDEMAVDMLYGDRYSKETKDRELRFLKEQRQKQEQMSNPNLPEEQGDFGELGAENEYNDRMEKTHIDELKDDLDIPDLQGFDSYNHEQRTHKRLKEQLGD